MRVGFGYDAHRFTSGRPLILGGVEIPHFQGLAGHSDADVLAHALGDALLGAAGLGDLGRHFPDTDPAYRGISSLVLLARIRELLLQAGYEPVNVDATVVAQRPKLAPFIPEMQRRLGQAVGLAPHLVNVKATTTEGMGFAGREEGIAAYAVALVRPVPVREEGG